MTRTPPEDRPSADDLQRGATAGSLTCPKCGCGHLERYGGSPLATGTIRRYRKCRNCGTPFVTSQPPERIVREVETTKEDEEERPVLKVRMA
jgi:transcriptional regulator NrdR family protein